MDFESFYKDKRVLITGGLGFIGSNLAIMLVNIGADVTIIDSLDKNCGGNEYNIDSVKDKIKVIKADIRDKDVIRDAVEGQQIIFNLAGHLSHKRSMKQPELDMSLNIFTSLSLLDACKKNRKGVKIVYTGTRGQYGKIIKNPVDENHPHNFIDVNGISKQTAERLHFLYSELYPQIRVTSARLTNCYGPRHQMKDPSQGFISVFIRKAIDNETLELWGGKQTRDLNFVNDVVNVLLLLGSEEKANGQMFNVGSGVDNTLENFANLIVKLCRSGEIKSISMPEDNAKIDIGNYKADISKLKRLFGWEPKTNIEEGLKKTIDFYKKNKEEYW
ncbi:MAG: GDP-mannose 4,6-dehydratase [Nanoarchaeota archaeon]|nr:GDP-mannose 4,6-dehydratase [Nanoarchaeota archaeon]MCG2718023.1 GDP-mannose 4,6-dehydratase [Nanoarchaeota archaeon]